MRRNFALTATSWRFLSEDERVAWCVRAKSKKSRCRLGKSWPLPGFNYYMRENVILANRGLPPLRLPPADPWQPRTKLPPLTRTLSPQELKLLLDYPQKPPESPGRAPP